MNAARSTSRGSVDSGVGVTGAGVVVVVPTYDEAENIAILAGRVHAQLPDAHLLVVDDGSPDGTAAVVRGLPGFGSSVFLMERERKSGLGNAYRAGFAWALEHGYAAVVQMDADLSHPAEALPAMLARLREDDVVVGSRYVAGGSTAGWGWQRRLISRIGSLYVRTVLGVRTHDTTAGFKAFRREALLGIGALESRSNGYCFQVENTWRAERRGYRVSEVPIGFVDRAAGTSKMSAGIVREAVLRVLGWRVRELGDRVRMPATAAIALAVLATLAWHLLFLSDRLLSDEGGFAMVAQQWSAHGGYLYGSQWVDRPPVLIGVFWVAVHLGPYGVRLTAAFVAAAFVAAAAWAGWAARDRRAAAWAAWIGAAFVSSAGMETFALNGELAAVPWVMASVAALLHALRRTTSPRRLVLLSMVSGLAATAAVLTKQSFVDAAVFAVLLLVATAARRPDLRHRVVEVAAGIVVGVALGLAPVLAWAATHAGVNALVFAAYGFRAEAAAVMAHYSMAAPWARAEQLLRLAVWSGLALVAVQLVLGRWRSVLARTPIALAVVGAAVAELLGVVGGGNFWPHYLIGLVPMLTLGVALSATARGAAALWTRAITIAVVAGAAVVTPASAQAVQSVRDVPSLVGQWVGSVAEPGDSVVVPYSHPNVVGASGLAAPYPYAWSLPVRTLDPHLDLLVRTLSRREGAPTWVVQWDPWQQWGLDGDRRVEQALASHYRQVAAVCGHAVWLHDGVERPRAQGQPDACATG